ncbi:glycosyltransferase family 2 protein [Bacillus niameyensis]|uniref:glycosyltransferase family 2 protein n=1 Tax=Bacillus niameyensis TaxID=1522308 RepID=UPI0009FE2C6A|nr:glycosyltransferase [Bacillus niameyensis]
MNPKISIIVPIYNVEDYLHQSISSILNQTFKDFELILVNDGSTDKCGEICDEYARQDSRLKVIHKENGGVSSARNRGIDAAKGEYIGYVDPDDEIEPQMYELLVNQAIRTNADMVVCQMKTINLNTNTISVSSVCDEGVLDKKGIKEKIIPAILDKKYFSLLSCANKLYRKSWLVKEEFRFDEEKSHGEDVRLNFKLLTHINCIVFVSKPLYIYYIRPRSSLTQMFREDLYEYIVDTKNSALFLCDQYKLEHLKAKWITEYINNTLNYLESVITSNLEARRKEGILKRIMEDQNFIQLLHNYQASSSFHRLLKRLCLNKSRLIIQLVVKAKFILRKITA